MQISKIIKIILAQLTLEKFLTQNLAKISQFLTPREICGQLLHFSRNFVREKGFS